MKPGKIGEIGGGYIQIIITGDTTNVTPAGGADIDLPTGLPPVAEIVSATYAKRTDGTPDTFTVTSYTVVTAIPTGVDEIYLKDYNTITVQDSAAYIAGDMLFLVCKLAPKGYTGSLHEA